VTYLLPWGCHTIMAFAARLVTVETGATLATIGREAVKAAIVGVGCGQKRAGACWNERSREEEASLEGTKKAEKASIVRSNVRAATRERGFIQNDKSTDTT